MSENGNNDNGREPILRIRNLTKTYMQGKIPVHALNDVSFEVKKGELISIVGPSGSGKSTLLSMIGLLDRPTGGSVFIEGKEITKANEGEAPKIRREKIGFVFQHFNLLPSLTAFENVDIAMRFSGIPRSRRKERATELLTQIGLGDRLKHRPSELSGGQQQRVSIARAMANHPAIILADEPTGAVDTKTREIIVGILKELSEKGQTILVVTHDMEVAGQTDRIITMRDGRIARDTESDMK
ncbi:ABC-type antimicrobial peptide transport system, ATPase component [Candidatus Methanoperedens nitroreducens]|uniref:ABC-type antimicrobial peptide transport system, ATPase component n=1 Tax=Candidatus Methanoperedens nitratireducens TaxID=1392998 RepID=A0A062V5M6_9EURY|nr:ABC transporter ATP-binding protein [Candidatus Methanoperedens nitroreducens]KCZ71104.1 ABC-type antimicrobial peptide transport system, ATPase component [Candidatus Methanoperedens nitroreducens]MDJ1421520.1 ABC transporter ATP-binding protein [Candidatus Methanoperedens sp.]